MSGVARLELLGSGCRIHEQESNAMKKIITTRASSATMMVEARLANSWGKLRPFLPDGGDREPDADDGRDSEQLCGPRHSADRSPAPTSSRT